MELTEARTIPVPRLLTRMGVREIRARLDDPPPAVLVLRGSPESFCEGMDLAELQEGADVRAGLQEYAECLLALRAYSRPVIAVIEGRVTAGGAGLVAACDVALASETASVSLPELLFGMLPAVVFPFLLERVTPQKAKLLALTARALNAKEALEIGLFDEVTPTDKMEKALRGWVRRLGRAAPDAAGAWKQYTAGLPLPALPHAVEAGAARMLDPRTRSAVRRFIEEGTAPWH